MIVLGISPLDKDATVSLVGDGRVLFAAGEERFTRVKLQSGFPERALEAALRHVGIGLHEIDTVAYPFLDWEKEARLFRRNLRDEADFLGGLEHGAMMRQLDLALPRVPSRQTPIPGLCTPNDVMHKPRLKRAWYRLAGVEGRVSRRMALRGSRVWTRETLAHHKLWQRELERHLHARGLLGKLVRYDHHLCHAASAYFASGFDRALIVTLDGYGTGLAGSVSLGEGTRIRRIHQLDYPHSLGTFYESVTSSLGFKPGRHEGKIVGLAAYGEPKVLLDLVLGRFEQLPGQFRVIESNNIYFSRLLAMLFPKVDVAAAYQRALEVVATSYIRHYVEQTGVDTVVLAGGVVANVKMNQRIYEIPGVSRLFVYPNMGDGGCGTGAAFLASRELLSQREQYPNVYFGPDYGDHEIMDAIRQAGLRFKRHEFIEPVIAKLIHEGKVVARFNGRMEYGPRALGNRSILYRATDPDVNQWLNQRLGRTEFMPFAPATLYEARHRCYHNIDGAASAAGFMTVTVDCTEFMKKACPAAVHVDGTARPQLVRKDANQSFHAIVRAYNELSGIPSIVNTSFNMHEEPIVNSPGDAIRAFLEGNLDYLAIGKLLVPHPSRLSSSSE